VVSQQKICFHPPNVIRDYLTSALVNRMEVLVKYITFFFNSCIKKSHAFHMLIKTNNIYHILIVLFISILYRLI
jgi:hypothetical protein